MDDSLGARATSGSTTCDREREWPRFRTETHALSCGTDCAIQTFFSYLELPVFFQSLPQACFMPAASTGILDVVHACVIDSHRRIISIVTIIRMHSHAMRACDKQVVATVEDKQSSVKQVTKINPTLQTGNFE